MATVRVDARDGIALEKPKTQAVRTAVLALTFTQGQEPFFSAIIHAHKDIIHTTIHNRDATHAVNIMLLRGQENRIRRLETALRQSPGILRASTVYTDLI